MNKQIRFLQTLSNTRLMIYASFATLEQVPDAKANVESGHGRTRSNHRFVVTVNILRIFCLCANNLFTTNNNIVLSDS